ncbi:MAG: hypothetical protein ACRC9R_05140 [Enterovibrio sp.]
MQAKFDVCYTVLGMNKWLRHHQFSYKRHIYSAAQNHQLNLMMDKLHILHVQLFA